MDFGISLRDMNSLATTPDDSTDGTDPSSESISAGVDGGPATAPPETDVDQRAS